MKTIGKIGILLFLSATLLTACYGGYYITARPAEPYYVRPASPYYGAVWIDGEWEWHDGRYAYIGGHWEKPRQGRVWVRGRWESGGRGYTWHRGYWR
jgi:hypothetical protein